MRLGASPARPKISSAGARLRSETLTEWLHPSPEIIFGERRMWAVMPARSRAEAVRWA